MADSKGSIPGSGAMSSPPPTYASAYGSGSGIGASVGHTSAFGSSPGFSASFVNPNQPPVPQSSSGTPDKRVALRIMVGVVLAGLAALAAYYCLFNGYNALDTATTSFQRFTGGALVYLGACFSFVAVGNIVYTAIKAGFSKDRYEEDFMKKQIAASILAPVVMIPFAIIAGIKANSVRSGASFGGGTI